MIQPPEASGFLIAGFVSFALVLAVGLVWLGHVAGRRASLPAATNRRLTMTLAILTAVWLTGTWMVAASGAIAQFDRRPPPIAVLFLAIAAVSVGLGFGPFGDRFLRGLPLWALVLTQAFRLPLELLMHEAAIEGVMPVQMSYSGRNFDILTGATAIPVACLLAAGYGGRRLAAAWNVLGTLLLANILGIAVMSTPSSRCSVRSGSTPGSPIRRSYGCRRSWSSARLPATSSSGGTASSQLSKSSLCLSPLPSSSGCGLLQPANPTTTPRL